MDKMNKKASGHIETVISFVIFIGFLIFLFSVFPVYTPEKSIVGLDSAERGILNLASMQVKQSTIVLNSVVSEKSCFCFTSTTLSKVVVRDENSKPVSSSYFPADRKLCINGGERFYEIYSSDDFIETAFVPDDCRILTGEEYSVGFVREIEAVSRDKLAGLASDYNSDYAKLKQELNLPKTDDFGFKINDIRGASILPEINASRSKPEKTEILARNVPVEIFFNNGTSIFAMINIQTW